MIFNEELGKRIRDMREEKGYLCSDIAEKTGVSETFIYQIERGEKGISAENLKNIAEVLEANADYLLFGNSNRPSDDELIKLTGKLDEDKRKIVIAFVKVIDEK